MISKRNDNIFTIKLPGSDLVFTRYLYIKQEVRIALLVSILNKSDEAIYWAYELYYSGFRHELFSLLWQIYYDFFATLNPSFEAYFLKKYNEWYNNLSTNKSPTLVSSIVQDLLFRPFNTDVFFLRNICEQFQIEIQFHNDTKKILNINDCKYNFTKWIEENDYRSIAQWILNENKDMSLIDVTELYKLCLDIFESIGINKLTKTKLLNEFSTIIKNNTIDPNLLLLSKIMCLFSQKAQLKKGRSIYISVEPENITQYNTIFGSNDVKHYKILEKLLFIKLMSISV